MSLSRRGIIQSSVSAPVWLPSVNLVSNGAPAPYLVSNVSSGGYAWYAFDGSLSQGYVASMKPVLCFSAGSNKKFKGFKVYADTSSVMPKTITIVGSDAQNGIYSNIYIGWVLDLSSEQWHELLYNSNVFYKWFRVTVDSLNGAASGGKLLECKFLLE